jgi:hypothetical protein
MSHRNVRDGIVGALVFVIGLIGFFLAWATADAIRPIPWTRAIFAIVSFPIFTLSSRHLANAYFWDLAILNCMLWAALAVWVMRLWKR